MIKAGFSRVDVTPPLGSFLAGYYNDRYSNGIIEPIELNALAVSDGENTAVIIAADFLGIRLKYATPIRQEIAERVGLPIENITITSLHQHTSIVLRDEAANNVMHDHAYLDFLHRKFCDVAEMAIADMTESTVSVGAKETAEPIAFIRRYIMTDGLVRTNPAKFRDQIVRPAEAPDNTVRLLKFEREGKKDIAFVNFPTHPDVIGGEKYSWDWPGHTRRYVEEDNKNVSCMTVTGFQGDSNHANFMGEHKRGYEHSLHMGRVIADAVRDMWNETEKKDIKKVSSKVSIVYNQTRTKGVEHFEECKEHIKKYYGDTTTKTESGLSYTEADRIVNMVNTAPLFQKIPVTLVELDDIAFYGLAGEPFTNYAAHVRAKYPEKFIFTGCGTNGYEGYLPTTVAYEQGGYEVVTSPFTPTIEDDCLKEIEKLFKGE